MTNGATDTAAVERELARILAAGTFERSPQVSGFLRYIVEAKLRGDEAGIKAYSVAVDVFGRPQDFDPQADPIVRVQARRLRAMLAAIYRAGPSPHGVEIRLPVGRYVPDFIFHPVPMALGESGAESTIVAAPAGALPSPAPPAADSPATSPSPTSVRPGRITSRALVVLALMPSAILILLVVIWGADRLGFIRLGSTGDTLKMPMVEVGEFLPVPSWGGDYVGVPGLAVELVTDLRQFDDIEARLVHDADGEPEAGTFLLTGLVRPQGSQALITATLRRVGSEEVAWSYSISEPIAGLSRRIDDISLKLSEQLGATLGPVHAPGHLWLGLHPEAYRSGERYVCELIKDDLLLRGGVERVNQAVACFTALLQRFPDDPEALAAIVSIGLYRDTMAGPPGELDAQRATEAEGRLARAQSLAGTSAGVWAALGFAREQLRQYELAAAAYRNALQLNPADLNVQAALGRLLLLAGPSVEGMRLAQSSVSRAPQVPPWFRVALAVDALRRSDNVALLAEAEAAAASDSELPAVLAAIGARRLGKAELLDRYLGQALESPRMRRYGMVPVIESIVRDPSLRRTISAELILAGVDTHDLTGGDPAGS